MTSPHTTLSLYNAEDNIQPIHEGDYEVTNCHLPQTPEEVNQVEELLEREFGQMSLTEQDQILFDVHGIPQSLDDDPLSIEEALMMIGNEMKCLGNSNALGKAMYINPEYVNSRPFRLMFLRSERHDPKLAAKRMMMHFEMKRELFGDGEILGRNVVLEDLDGDDMECLQSGYVQILPERDVSGRVVIFAAMMKRKYKNVENMVSGTLNCMMMQD